jgi:hypothetical protein
MEIFWAECIFVHKQLDRCTIFHLFDFFMIHDTSTLHPSRRTIGKAIAAMVIVIALTLPTAPAVAQSNDSLATGSSTPFWAKTQVFVPFGWTAPYFFSGQEIMRSAELRNQETSYFTPTGTKRSVGTYRAPSGFAFGIGFMSPIPALQGLMLGSGVYTSLTGSTPSGSGITEGYFFNFLLATFAARYYVLGSPVFVQGEVGVASVWTKNRYLNANGAQEFFHQFGFGAGAAATLGFSVNPFQNSPLGFDITVSYQAMNSRVEVNTIGDDVWVFGALRIGGAVRW